MSLVDPRAGRAFIWIITCFLFFSIISGGGCLLMYMILPESETTAWLPVVGMILVCLPWFFWLLTFLYRIVSRTCGFRVSLGIGATGTGGGGGGGGGDNDNNGFGAEAAQNGSAESQGDGRENGHDGDQRRSGSSSSSSSSIISRESEMPFAISMGS